MAQQQKNNSPESVVKHIEDIFRLAKTGPIKDTDIAKLDKNVLSIIIGALTITQSEVFLKNLFGKEYKKRVKSLKLKPKSSLQIAALDPTMKEKVSELYAAYIEIDDVASEIAGIPTLSHLTEAITREGSKISEIEHLLRLNPHLLNAQDEDGFCPLITATNSCHLDKVLFLLSKNCNTRFNTSDGINALQIAAIKGYTPIAEALLEADSDLIHLKTTKGYTALFFAAQSGHLGTVQFLLSKKCSEEDQIGALLVAIKKRHTHIVTALLDANSALINPFTLINTFNGYTSALHIAVYYKHPEIVDVLLSRKCDPKIQTIGGNLALHMAAENGDLSIVSALVRADRDSVNAKDQKGDTPAHLALHNGHNTVLQFLIKEGCDLLNAVDNDGWTLLHTAARKGDMQTAIDLLTSKPELINQQTKSGLTALILAAANGHLDLMNFLLEQNADIELYDNNGASVLHFAAHSHEKVVSMLLQQYPALAKKKINLKHSGYTALSVAIYYKQKNIVSTLLEADPEAISTTPILSEATASGDADIVELVLEKKPSREQIIEAFKQAIISKHLPIIDILKKHVSDSSAWFEILQTATILGRQGILARLLADPQVKLEREEVKNLLDLARKAKPQNKGICNVLFQKLKEFPKSESLTDSTDSSTGVVLSTLIAASQTELETETTAADSKSIDKDVDKSITQAQQSYSHIPAVADELAKIVKQNTVYAAFKELMRISQTEKNRRYSGTGLGQFEPLRFSAQKVQQLAAAKRKTELAELGYFEVFDEKRLGKFFVTLSEDAMTKVPAPVQHKIIAELTKGTKFDKRPGIVRLKGEYRHSIIELSIPKEDGRLIGYMSKGDQKISLRSGAIKNAHVITLCDYASTHAAINHTAKLVDQSLSRDEAARNMHQISVGQR